MYEKKHGVYRQSLVLSTGGLGMYSLWIRSELL